MAASVDNIEEQDKSRTPGNSQPQQTQGHGDDSGAGAAEKRWPGWPGETVFRLLVPNQKVGGIIGRKGEFIKKMCEESRARIKILDGPPGTPERVVLISAKEEQDASIPPAVDGLLRVHKCTVDGLDNELAPGNKVSTRLLVAAAQAGSLIGKQGASIKSIQEASDCIVRVLGPEDLPVVALQDDRVVEIQGEPAGIRKAVELIASHLRKFLVDRTVLPLFEMHKSVPPNFQREQNMHHTSWAPRGLSNAGGSGFGGNSQFMPPRHDNYYPPSDLPPLDKQPHSGLAMFGRDAPHMGAHPPTNAQRPQPIITQMTQQIQIPLSYADAVIGTAGASISYIRRASGATITIQESRGTPGEMTVEINGTATQVQTAQQLIQNFMAEAAGGPQNPVASGDPGYNSYQTHSLVYSSPPSNAGHAVHAGGHAGHGGGVYGANYGY